LPFYYAKDKKLFEKHDLEAQFIQVPSPLQVAALVSGDLDFIFSPSVAIRGIGKGMPFKVVAVAYRVALQSLVSQLSPPKALERKKIAVNRIGTGPYFFGVLMLEKSDVDPKKVNWIQTGDTALSMTALEQGRVEGGVLSPPFTGMLVEKGFKILKRSRDVTEGDPGNGLVTTREEIQSHPDRITKAIKALLEAVRSIRRDRQGVIAYIIERFKMSRGIAEDAYEDVLGVLSDDLTIDEGDLKKYLEMLYSRGETRKLLTPSDVMDNSFLRAIKQDGREERERGRDSNYK
jgi:NitT/TauT family transport system substrate-binding protein